jgi:ferredoxin-NADP reductase
LTMIHYLYHRYIRVWAARTKLDGGGPSQVRWVCAMADGSLRVQITDVADEACAVKSLGLCAVDGQKMPIWTPGAHIDVVLPSGLVRQYSLCGDPSDWSQYRIAVLRQDDGRGGSTELHQIAAPGVSLSIRGPRNHFPLVAADRYLFVAGGIGVTPMLPMIHQAQGRGASWRMIYGGRSRDAMAFVRQLRAMGRDLVDIVPQDERGLLDLETELAALASGTAIYCCGPEPLINAVQYSAKAHGKLDAVHVERFAGSSAPRAADAEGACAAIDVTCALSKISFTVPPGRSILDLVHEHVDPDYPYSCAEGFCGNCVTRVLGGVPDYRDEILTDEERAENKIMMICVDRSLTKRLVLDL